jgi:hypothetical protein
MSKKGDMQASDLEAYKKQSGKVKSVDDMDQKTYFSVTGAVLADPTVEGLLALQNLFRSTSLKSLFSKVDNDTLKSNLMQPVTEVERLLKLPFWKKKVDKMRESMDKELKATHKDSLGNEINISTKDGKTFSVFNRRGDRIEKGTASFLSPGDLKKIDPQGHGGRDSANKAVKLAVAKAFSKAKGSSKEFAKQLQKELGGKYQGMGESMSKCEGILTRKREGYNLALDFTVEHDEAIGRFTLTGEVLEQGDEMTIALMGEQPTFLEMYPTSAEGMAQAISEFETRTSKRIRKTDLAKLEGLYK